MFSQDHYPIVERKTILQRQASDIIIRVATISIALITGFTTHKKVLEPVS